MNVALLRLKIARMIQRLQSFISCWSYISDADAGPIQKYVDDDLMAIITRITGVSLFCRWLLTTWAPELALFSNFPTMGGVSYWQLAVDCAPVPQTIRCLVCMSALQSLIFANPLQSIFNLLTPPLFPTTIDCLRCCILSLPQRQSFHFTIINVSQKTGCQLKCERYIYNIAGWWCEWTTDRKKWRCGGIFDKNA